jgi:uncharacterized repeat protein (TIGR04076 family)
MNRCRIKVLRRMVHQDLVDEYLEPGVMSLPCPRFEDGQEFVVEDGGPPDDFCDSAWNEIHKVYLTLVRGGDFTPWMREEGTMIACCTDGFRPVVFELKRIEG